MERTTFWGLLLLALGLYLSSDDEDEFETW